MHSQGADQAVAAAAAAVPAPAAASAAAAAPAAFAAEVYAAAAGCVALVAANVDAADAAAWCVAAVSADVVGCVFDDCCDGLAAGGSRSTAVSLTGSDSAAFAWFSDETCPPHSCVYASCDRGGGWCVCGLRHGLRYEAQSRLLLQLAWNWKALKGLGGVMQSG